MARKTFKAKLEHSGVPGTSDELQAALKKNAAARRAFAEMSYSCQREYADYVREAKKPETRQARAAKSVGMIAEKQRLRG
ncbi:MAG: YdeI/OmpD-associated family protein [Hyalangium sp.]|uniref:YdeI/OmpD-associated family protein n=1 Tax=Hyalangium sp. TaxID=2028555 RepID=UPI003899EAC8